MPWNAPPVAGGPRAGGRCPRAAARGARGAAGDRAPRGGRAAAVVSLAALVAGAGVAADKPAAGVPEVVRARRFQVVDGEGGVAADLASGGFSGGTLLLRL